MKHSKQRPSGSSATSIRGNRGDSWETRCGTCATKMWLATYTLLFYSLLRTGTCLELLRLDIPKIADPRWDKIVLRCEYDLGTEELYSVKWYKDGSEFFRFMPGSKPAGRNFSVDGVHVDVNRSDSKQVTLLGQSNNSKGKVNLVGSYGCEVSSEGPSFHTIYDEANMSVAIPPKERPTLRGLRPSYEAGEILYTECTSAPSYPPAQLTFVLNGKEVTKPYTKELPTGPVSEDSILSISRLRLSVRLERHHFQGGTLTVTCQATLPGVPDIKVMEKTEIATLAANNQRLAQEPPRSSSKFNEPFLLIVISCCAMLFMGTGWSL